jgi:hypothetical protein
MLTGVSGGCEYPRSAVAHRVCAAEHLSNRYVSECKS